MTDNYLVGRQNNPDFQIFTFVKNYLKIKEKYDFFISIQNFQKRSKCVRSVCDTHTISGLAGFNSNTHTHFAPPSVVVGAVGRWRGSLSAGGTDGAAVAGALGRHPAAGGRNTLRVRPSTYCLALCMRVTCLNWFRSLA